MELKHMIIDLKKAVENSETRDITLNKTTAIEILSYLEVVKGARELDMQNLAKREQEFKNSLIEDIANINLMMIKTILDKEVETNELTKNNKPLSEKNIKLRN